MSKKILILLSFLILQVAAFQSSAAIGDWKAYMAYSEVQEIEEAGNWIFVQASSNLYAYNRNDQSIQTFSKMDFLNDCDIQHIAYNKTAKRLLILYNNANIDLMNTQNWSVQNRLSLLWTGHHQAQYGGWGNQRYLSTGIQGELVRNQG